MEVRSVYNINIAVANDSSFLTGDQENVLSLSNPSCKVDDKMITYLTNVPDTTSVLALLLHKQTNDPYRRHDSMTRFTFTDKELSDRNTFSNQKESHSNLTNFQYDLLLTKSANRILDVHNSSENRLRSCSNNGLYSIAEGTVSEVLGTSETAKVSSGIQAKEVGTSSLFITKLNRHDDNGCYSITVESSELQDHDNQPTKALLDINTLQPLPVIKTSCACIHEATPSFPSDLKEAIAKLGTKEKLTRRELVQITGMMALGFVFVTLIVVWVLSPILF